MSKLPPQNNIIFTRILVFACILVFICSFLTDCFVTSGTGQISGPVLSATGLIPCYPYAETITVSCGGEKVPCRIYYKAGAPYVLIGPFHFGNGRYDFFFVRKNDVVGRGLDDKTADWRTHWFGAFLFICFDLDPDGIDSWCPNDSFSGVRIRYDRETDSMVYLIPPSQGLREIRFSVPCKYLNTLSPAAKGYW